MPALEVLSYLMRIKKHSAEEVALRDLLNVMYAIWRPLAALLSHLHPSQKQYVKFGCLMQERYAALHSSIKVSTDLVCLQKGCILPGIRAAASAGGGAARHACLQYYRDYSALTRM